MAYEKPVWVAQHHQAGGRQAHRGDRAAPEEQAALEKSVETLKKMAEGVKS